MSLRFYNNLVRSVSDFRPYTPPGIIMRHDDSLINRDDRLIFLRNRVILDSLRRALEDMGYLISSEKDARSGRSDIYFGDEWEGGVAAQLWLKSGTVVFSRNEDSGLKEMESQGFSSLDFRLLCLQTHYRLPLVFSWRALESARTDRRHFLELAGALKKQGSGVGNWAGLAAYRKRFSDALANDLNWPAALSSIWDCLRPGALSPGSQLRMLSIIDPIWGLQVFDSSSS